jgi:4'-phosphopantetheinyl transferase EntD
VTIDPQLQQDLARLAGADLRIGHRLIQPGDEQTLYPEEAVALAARSLTARRASGAARLVARELMTQLGVKPGPIRGTPAGAPDWPRGLTGSLAHDDAVAVAVIGRSSKFAGLGIDVEAATPLPSEMLDLVTTPREQALLAADPFRGRLHFAAKEAVYKAVQPLDGLFLEFHDIEVDLAARIATVRNGRTLALMPCVTSRLVVVAVA